jgi:hypothetical protein
VDLRTILAAIPGPRMRLFDDEVELRSDKRDVQGRVDAHNLRDKRPDGRHQHEGPKVIGPNR